MTWTLNLASWIIQDGNYGDVVTGDRLDAAVEFGFQSPPALVENVQPSAQILEDSIYDVVGRVIAIEADVWVIDIGISVFEKRKPPAGVAVGDLVAGAVFLGVDPFFYFERLAKRETLPPLIYSWDVREIVRQTAPFIEARPKLLIRDPDKLGWEAIKETNAWVDDNGSAEYLMRCELRATPPQRIRRCT